MRSNALRIVLIPIVGFIVYTFAALSWSYSDGDRSGIPASKQIFVPTLAIKKEQVEDFAKKINQLRGR